MSFTLYFPQHPMSIILKHMVVVHNGMGDDLTIPLQGAGTYDLLSESFEGAWPPPGWQVASMNTINDVGSKYMKVLNLPDLAPILPADDYTQYQMTPQVSLTHGCWYLSRARCLPYSFGTEVFAWECLQPIQTQLHSHLEMSTLRAITTAADWLEADISVQTFIGTGCILSC